MHHATVSLLAFAFMPGALLAGQDPPSIAQARTVLEKAPDDPKANLTLGIYLGTVKNDWAAALPLLKKTQDTLCSPAAKRELEAADNGFDWVEIGDLWTTASQKNKDARSGLKAHAAECYSKAWDKLTDAIWKDKLREKLKSVQRTGPASIKTSGKYPKGWAAFSGGSAAGGDAEFVRTGRQSLKLVPPNPKEADASTVKSDFVLIPEGSKVKVSAWVFTEGNEGNGDDFAFSFVSAANRSLAGQLQTQIRSDRPFWTRIEMETAAPPGCVKGNILVVFKSKAGYLVVDDVSVTVDGKEVLPNPSFE